MEKQRYADLINNVVPGLFKKHFLPLLDKKNIESAIKDRAAAFDTEFDSLKIPEDKKMEVFDLGSMMFFSPLVSGAYEYGPCNNDNKNFHTDMYCCKILTMKRQKLLREFALKLLAHYFAERLHNQKVNITMYLVGMSEQPSCHAPVEYASAYAETDDPILIMGESGTGKELVAKAIHYLSRRKKEIFIPINCGGIPEGSLQSDLFGHIKGAFTGAISDRTGAFEAAKGGTIFLDEVGDMPAKVQVALLRTLNDGKIRKLGDEFGKEIWTDTRVIAATNKNLQQEVKDGRFREDLYYRLCGHPMRLPSFRDLPEDDRIDKIRMIFNAVLQEQSGQDIEMAQFLFRCSYSPSRLSNGRTMTWKDRLGEATTSDFSRCYPISQDAALLLIDQDFPGNYRQINSVLRNAWVKTKKRIEVEHLSKELLSTDKETVSAPSEAWLHLSAPEFQQRIENLERERINRFLTKAKGKVTKAADAMGIRRHRLASKMNRLGVSKKPS